MQNPLKYEEEFPQEYCEKQRPKVASNGATTFENNITTKRTFHYLS
jgi:UDP-3-O-acyl-N-acetylglucosamine deacetylase